MSQLAIELRPGEGGDDAFAFCKELRTCADGSGSPVACVTRPLGTRPGSASWPAR
jgi:hypothetical protein